MTAKLTLNFRSLANEDLKGKGKGKGKAFPAVVLEADPADSKALAAIVSVQAEKLVPGLKEKDLRVRITTPDGRPWDPPSFYVEDRNNGARYGWGTVSLLINPEAPMGRLKWKEFSVWNG